MQNTFKFKRISQQIKNQSNYLSVNGTNLNQSNDSNICDASEVTDQSEKKKIIDYQTPVIILLLLSVIADRLSGKQK